MSKNYVDPKELRVGNSVYVNWNDAGRKEEINYGVFNLPAGCMSGWENSTGWRMNTAPNGYAVHIEMVNPIILTSEWLTRLGFVCEKVNEFQEYWSREDDEGMKLDWLTLSRHDPASFYVLGRVTGDYFLSFTERSVYIFYVHQLQNLYYSLTGEELLIQEKK